MIRRKIRVDLSQFDPDWQDCFILLVSAGIDDQLGLQKHIRKIEREQKEIDKKIKEIKEDKKIQELEDKSDELTKKMGYVIYDQVEQHFLSGIIYDFDEKKSREMKKEDIRALDLEVIKFVYGRLAGVLEKKV